ncbi:MAG: hypothetical protein K1X94_16720 [Sandaracinaceae bacterium]|nr:hypothetical protein [Sandaracinaceae bacterium]
MVGVTSPARPSPEEMNAIAQRAVDRSGAVMLWWIVGLSIGSIPLAFVGVVVGGEAAVAFEAVERTDAAMRTFALESLLPTVALFVVVLAVVVGLIQLAIHLHKSVTRNSVLRMLREGTPHVGRIVQARRISMTQSRVSVQGATFAPFDAVLVTAMADAALYGREITVYTRPGAPPMTMPFD